MKLLTNPRSRAVYSLLTGLALIPYGMLVAMFLMGPGSSNTTRANDSVQNWHSGPVHHIELTWEDPPYVPPGPHREQFAANCRICHSPRLPLTQPPMTQKKWGEVVHKMAAVYGAPVRPEDEPALVAYLFAVRGKHD